VSTRAEIETFYRSAEDYRRYLPSDPETRRRVRALVRAERRWLGNSLLDLACGGGALAHAYLRPGRSYLGVDLNRDMLREARQAAAGLPGDVRFEAADLARWWPRGRFDTVALLGNALSHLTAADFEALLGRVTVHVERPATWVVDYRDTVGLFFRGQWKRTYVQRKVGRRIKNRTESVDFGRGAIRIATRTLPRGRTVRFVQTIWSPFVVASLMQAHGWRLVRRTPARTWAGWRDTYRRV
jgi:SAM-dependent methyltransferase